MKKILILLLIPAICFAEPNISKNIKILPLSQMDFPQSLKNEMKAYNSNLKTIGYNFSDNPYPRKLLQMGHQSISFSTSKDPENTDIKKNLSEIKLNFLYKSISKNIIGYAPLGLYTKDGWAGVKEFFNEKK